MRHTQDEHRHDRWQDAGQGDVQQLFPFGRAVHRRRLIQRGVDAGERGQIDDRAVARCLPDIRKHIHRLKVFRLRP